MVSEGKTLLVCGTKLTPCWTRTSARRLVMSWSRRVTVPLFTRTRPNMALSRVDLPAPLGPMIPTSSPSVAVREQPLRILTPGKYPATRSWALMRKSPLSSGAAGVGAERCSALRSISCSKTGNSRGSFSSPGGTPAFGSKPLMNCLPA